MSVNPEICTENPFEGFFKGMENLEETPLRRKEEFDMGVFDTFMFEQQIQNLDRMNDQDAFNFIKNNIEYISTAIINKEWKFPMVLVSDKFLRVYARILASMPISHTIRLATNKICYDYNTISEEKFPKNEETKRAVLNLSKTVNYPYINSLMGIGLPNDVACNLALCRFSSIDETVNIKRLNFHICQQDPELMTTQMIIWIYEKLFDKVGDLFKQTMFEYYSPEEELDLGNDFQEIYSTISLAILVIVNNLTLSDIDKLIRGYIADWEYIGRPPVRFSLISLSADYSRIQRVVENITNEGTYVP